MLQEPDYSDREKHVGFEEESDSDEEDGVADHEGKLRRRDTPHHLKNKRITLGGSKEEAEEKVRAILAQASAHKAEEKKEITINASVSIKSKF